MGAVQASDINLPSIVAADTIGGDEQVLLIENSQIKHKQISAMLSDQNVVTATTDAVTGEVEGLSINGRTMYKSSAPADLLGNVSGVAIQDAAISTTAGLYASGGTAYKCRVTWNNATLPPGPLTAATAGSGSTVTDGVHRFWVAFTDAAGNHTELGASAVITVTGNDDVNLTAIPLGPAWCTGRKVYVSTAGGSVPYLLATIADNTTTTGSLTVADATITGYAVADNTNTINTGTVLYVAANCTNADGSPNPVLGVAVAQNAKQRDAEVSLGSSVILVSDTIISCIHASTSAAVNALTHNLHVAFGD